jgi:hypothetical protein
MLMKVSQTFMVCCLLAAVPLLLSVAVCLAAVDFSLFC